MPIGSALERANTTLQQFEHVSTQSGDVFLKEDGTIKASHGVKGSAVEFLRQVSPNASAVASYDANKARQNVAAAKELFEALTTKHGLDTVLTVLDEHKGNLSAAWTPILQRMRRDTTPSQRQGIPARLTCDEVHSVLEAVHHKAHPAHSAAQAAAPQRSTPIDGVNGAASLQPAHLAALTPESIRLQHVADATLAHVESITPLGAPNRAANLHRFLDLGIDNRKVAMQMDVGSQQVSRQAASHAAGKLPYATECAIKSSLFIRTLGCATCGLQTVAAYDHLANTLGERNICRVTISDKADHVFLVIGATKIPTEPISFANLSDIALDFGPDARVIDPWARKSYPLREGFATRDLAPILDEVINDPRPKETPTSFTFTIDEYLPAGDGPVSSSKELTRALNFQFEGMVFSTLPEPLRNSMKEDILQSGGSVFYGLANSVTVSKQRYPWIMTRQDASMEPSSSERAYEIFRHIGKASPAVEAFLNNVGAAVAKDAEVVFINHAPADTPTRFDPLAQRLTLGRLDAQELATALNAVATSHNLAETISPAEVSAGIARFEQSQTHTPETCIRYLQSRCAMEELPPSPAALAQRMGMVGNVPAQLGPTLAALGQWHKSIGQQHELTSIEAAYHTLQDYLTNNPQSHHELFTLQQALNTRRDSIYRTLTDVPAETPLPDPVSPQGTSA